MHINFFNALTWLWIAQPIAVLSLPQEISNSTFTKTQQNDSICVGGGNQWTGKVSVSHGNSLFYWYFESQNAPKDAPLVTYFSGGPGQAGISNIFLEMGPCSITANNTAPRKNNFTWVKDFNMVFIDAIAGEGLSKTNIPNTYLPTTLEEISTDLKMFFHTFVTEAFPDLSGKDLHVGGESFGGTLAVAFSTALTNLSSPGPIPEVRLRSVMIGDGFLDLGYMYPSYYDALCAGATKYLNDTVCNVMASYVGDCETSAAYCRLNMSMGACRAAADTCGRLNLFGPPNMSQNPYHLGQTCNYPRTCALRDTWVDTYINNSTVQAALGFSGQDKVDFKTVDFNITKAVTVFGDFFESSLWRLTYLLNETDVHVLAFSGVLDGKVPSISAYRALDSTHWLGQAPFRAKHPTPWTYISQAGDSVLGGNIKSYKQLTWMEFCKAGHYVAVDAPEPIYYVVYDWIFGVLGRSKRINIGLGF